LRQRNSSFNEYGKVNPESSEEPALINKARLALCYVQTWPGKQRFYSLLPQQPLENPGHTVGKMKPDRQISTASKNRGKQPQLIYIKNLRMLVWQ